MTMNAKTLRTEVAATPGDSADRAYGLRKVGNTGRGFDITCVVGTVTLGEGDIQSPTVAAMRMIGENCNDGTYRFPNVDVPYEDFVVTIAHERRGERNA